LLFGRFSLYTPLLPVPVRRSRRSVGVDLSRQAPLADELLDPALAAWHGVLRSNL
jgi:hypothetical protein